MNVGAEALFTSALGLVSPWEVEKVDLDTARRRIDFEVRRGDLHERPAALAQLDPDPRRSLLWSLRKHPLGRSITQLETMHWLKESNLKSARARRLKMVMREVYAQARTSNDAVQAEHDLRGWISWARRCRLGSFKRPAATLQTHIAAVVHDMTDNRSYAFVEAMNGLLQQAKRAARGFRTPRNFIAITCLPADVQTQAPASPSVRACLSEMRRVRSTLQDEAAFESCRSRQEQEESTGQSSKVLTRYPFRAFRLGFARCHLRLDDGPARIVGAGGALPTAAHRARAAPAQP